MEKFKNLLTSVLKTESKLAKLADQELLDLEKTLQEQVTRELDAWYEFQNLPVSDIGVSMSANQDDHEKLITRQGEKLAKVRKKLTAVKNEIWNRGLRTGTKTK